MINPKLFLDNIEFVKENILRRRKNIDMDPLIILINKTRHLKQEIDKNRACKKLLSKEFGMRMTKKESVDKLKADIDVLEKKITKAEQEYNELERQKRNLLLKIPNILDNSVPDGKDETENVVIKEYPPKEKLKFKPLTHIELGEKNDIIDFKSAVELAGSRFVLLKNKGAILHRALANFMLNEQAKMGYEELYTPFLVKRSILEATGQIPDKEDDIYKIEGENLYLIPTVEVTLVNYGCYIDLNESDLPKRLTGVSANFRKEAGSYGKDVRGMIRVHQFDAVELISITTPEDSFDELEKMREAAENILKLLELPYKVIVLSSGDTGFTAAKTYDLEVWIPSENRYREVSSISNCTDFQARRLNFKYRNKNGERELVHTLNGTGLAIGRTFLAVLENYQREDGSIIIPKVLRKYTNFDIIK